MEMEKEISRQIQDTIIHKKIVMDAAMKMYFYLNAHGDGNLGLELIKKAAVHDNSKFHKSELYGLASIGDNSSLKNPDVLLSNDEEQIIRIHWKHNRHHPEHFDRLEDMEEIDIIEMCCDWYARSIQYGTDLISFFHTRQENRFHFPPKMVEKIEKYCHILLAV